MREMYPLNVGPGSARPAFSETVARASTETPGDDRNMGREQHLTITEVFFGARRCGNVRFCNAKNQGPYVDM